MTARCGGFTKTKASGTSTGLYPRVALARAKRVVHDALLYGWDEHAGRVVAPGDEEPGAAEYISGVKASQAASSDLIIRPRARFSLGGRGHTQSVLASTSNV